MNPILYLAGKLNPKFYYQITQLRYKLPFVGKVLSGLGNYIRNRDGVISQGLGKGLKFNVGNSIAGYLIGTQEPQVQAATGLMVKPGMVAYDLGANVGYLTVIMSRLVGDAGKVIAFEPWDKNVRTIEHNISMNGLRNIQVRTEAIGKADAKATFSTADFATTGKLEAYHIDQVQGESREVSVRSLDSLIEKGEVPPPDFIKMDIEGAEVDGLRGAEKLLAGKRPIVLIELHNTNSEVNALLAAANYESIVLGSKETILQGHWNVQILAIPAERPLAPEDRAALTNEQLTPWR